MAAKRCLSPFSPLESVVAGALIACAKIDGHNAAQRDGMLMGREAGVRDRMIEIDVRNKR